MKKSEILITSSVFILICVISIITEYWYGMIFCIFMFGNALWTEYEDRKLAGKDPMTQSVNKNIIILGGLFMGIGITFIAVIIYNRNYTPIDEAIALVFLLGGLTLALHEFFKRYRAVSYKSK